jgi:hypothetical protein
MVEISPIPGRKTKMVMSTQCLGGINDAMNMVWHIIDLMPQTYRVVATQVEIQLGLPVNDEPCWDITVRGSQPRSEEKKV